MSRRDPGAGPWQLVIPAPAPWLNANQRRDRRRQAVDVRAWRQAAGWRAKQAKLPRGLARVHILAELHMTDRRRRDPHNYYPTIKAVVDGLVDHGLIADDDASRLDGPDIRLGGQGLAQVSRLILTITEVARG